MNLSLKNVKRIVKRSILILLILVVLIVICLYILKRFIFPLKYFDIIKEASKNYNLDPYLVLSIIRAESGFNQSVTSAKQAKGLMQIIDSTAEEMDDNESLLSDETDIYNETTNITLGCKYLASLIKRYQGNYYLAIIAYNAGMGNVDKWINEGILESNLDYCSNDIPFNETRKYLKKVINSYKMYRVLY